MPPHAPPPCPVKAAPATVAVATIVVVVETVEMVEMATAEMINHGNPLRLSTIIWKIALTVKMGK